MMMIIKSFKSRHIGLLKLSFFKYYNQTSIPIKSIDQLFQIYHCIQNKTLHDECCDINKSKYGIISNIF